jgi:CRISPR/Cas system CMR subunit Cmr6 (Cas7 group RAMP superfamily)
LGTVFLVDHYPIHLEVAGHWGDLKLVPSFFQLHFDPTPRLSEPSREWVNPVPASCLQARSKYDVCPWLASFSERKRSLLTLCVVETATHRHFPLPRVVQDDFDWRYTFVMKAFLLA